MVSKNKNASKKNKKEDTEMLSKINELVDKVDSMKKKEKMDLSSDQDLTIAIMNLISIEEHLFFSGAKTGKNEYFELIEVARDMRKSLLKKIIKDYEGEVWCISKHLLASSMRLMEVGTKQQSMGNKKEAYDLFHKGYNLYSLFWGLNMNIINVSDVKNVMGEDLAASENEKESKGKKKAQTKEAKAHQSVKTKSKKEDKEDNSFLGKLGDFVNKAIDCCKE